MNKLGKDVRDGYRTVAQPYHLGRVAREAVNVEWLDSLLEHLPSSGKAVDLGCGSGVPITRYFADHGYEVVGYDISDEMLEIARREVPGASFYRLPLEDLRLEPSSMDLVVSFFAIIHVDRSMHKKLFARIYEWLRPGGGAMLSLGAEDNPLERRDDWYGSSMAWSHFGAETNLAMLASVGFDIVWHEVEDFGHEKHLFVIVRKPGE